MKQVDFYILEAGINRLFFTCELIEKAYKKKHRIYIQCNDEAQCFAFDDTLWGFKETSFVPHNIQGEGPTPPPPVQIGFSDEAKGYHDVLINLADEVPAFYTQFNRIIEIVDDNEDQKVILRKHFQWYKSQGERLRSHPIKKRQTQQA